MPIYTKKGDKGLTKTFHGAMSKSDDLAEALGSIDELNSWIGLIRQRYTIYDIRFMKLEVELKRIQTNLMTMASILAGSTKYEIRDMRYETRRLEKLIDKLTAELPPLSNFIYPLGELQVARAVARRAERQLVRYMKSDIRYMNKTIMKYINRLSDAIFTMARWVNFKMEIPEETWK